MNEQTEVRFRHKMNYDSTGSTRESPDLAVVLELVERQELVRRLVEAELAYSFKHALTQDAAYSTLMKQERS